MDAEGETEENGRERGEAGDGRREKGEGEVRKIPSKMEPILMMIHCDDGLDHI